MEPRCTIITSPLCDSVYQRNQDNIAIIPIVVLYTRPVNKIKIKAFRPDYDSDWVELILNYSTAKGNISVPAGDWYRIHMQAFDENGGIVEEDTSIQVGVGEVFVTCGQSNSLNFGDTLTKSQSLDVVSFHPENHTWQLCADPQPTEYGPEVDMGNGGSIWPTVGDFLAKELHMPVGFYSTGWGGAGISEFGSDMVKYRRLLNALEFFGDNGLRAVLWHQGETDAIYNPDTQYYKNLLTDLIYRSRKDAGWEVSWVIAQAAYHPKAAREDEKLIRIAQEMCCNGKDILPGPNSDTLQGDYRILNSAHFTLKGLKAHGMLWAAELKKLFYFV
ncbi:carbohydrate esterase-like sialic acid-specific acetylesterase [Mobilisporobacter senegalensis]|uniref:Carbohydrate esterase-like sialic acid-specific acetylesterase n=1 Tax=Mobilisporobacter senegalensis TaxID=1329262 RepID=A0A3N1XNL5_9FIRM|nr:sialate O-acetylesterase [Mobilisporobacter senegalensis]ROR28274.1 carbohydrate esterase-like sialic acid-specific acetylesterase [Mobilisporobacter senegalensis]